MLSEFKISKTFWHTPMTTSIAPAMQFILDRKQVYADHNRMAAWNIRGIGYLYEEQEIVLQGELPRVVKLGLNTIRIHNVEKPTDCSKVLLWVRVNGPEIFAGQAIHSSKNEDACHWEFQFDARVPGSYLVDAKVLLWNPDASALSSTPGQCEQSQNASLAAPFSIHAGFIGFKMYHPEAMCCQICTLLAGHCKAWATPVFAFPEGELFKRGCELFFSRTSNYVPDSIFHKEDELEPIQEPLPKYKAPTYGLPHSEPTTYFVGCGWSYWFTLEFPCISGDLDDRVFFLNDTIIFSDWSTDTSSSATTAETEQEHEQHEQPLCTIDQDSLNKHEGRWVREPWPNATMCPHPMQLIYQDENKYHIAKFDSNHPQCWHRDDLSKIGKTCLEVNCRFIEPGTKWNSSLHQEEEFFGRWKHDECTYLEFTDSQLQQCVDRRKLIGYTVEGNSIAEMLIPYMQERLKNITFYDDEIHDDGTRVTVSTLKLLHHCAEQEEVLIQKFKKLPNVTANEEFFWINGYFLSSEREFACTAARMKKFNLLGEQILEPKGYKMINAYDMSAAFTYDAACQNDGMHIIGPPMKMIVTKLLHYLCSTDDGDHSKPV